MSENFKTEIEIKRAAQMSAAEFTLGSIGHAFKIPLTGQILSLNQLGFLLNILNRDQLALGSVFEVSGIAAVLKTFSPVGKKLGPMLSIAMQGFLFWFGCFLFQGALLGQILGAALLALWSFIQPLITYFLVYGFNILDMVQFYKNRLQQDYSFLTNFIYYGFFLVLFLKITLAVGLVLYSYLTKKEIQLISDDRFKISQAPPTVARSAWRMALRDIFRPLFLFSFILMALFVSQLETTLSEKIWISLRPLAVAYLLFLFLRSTWIQNKIMNISQKSKRLHTFYLKAQSALNLMTQRTTRSSKVSSRGKFE